jgi:hypothetical protein
MLNTEVSGNGIRERVTACRKRLRGTRILHRPHAPDHTQDVFAQANMTADSPDFTGDYPTMRESPVHSGQSASSPVIRDEEPALTIVREEVGIT